MWTEKFQHNERRDEEVKGYKGIPIYAGYNLHEKSFEVFTEYVKDKSAKIIVLGAGAGAFDQRLIDHGYTNILAVEYHEDLYRPKTKVVSRDLNKDFADLGTFDVVIAIEIIEHLENQFHLLLIHLVIDAQKALYLLFLPLLMLQDYLEHLHPVQVYLNKHIDQFHKS